MRSARRIVAGALVGAAVLAALPWRSLAEDPPRARDVTLVYTGDLEGELEPCGCTEGQLGGLARRAAWINAAKATGEHVVLLDSGDLYFRREAIPKILEPQLRLKARTIAGIHERLHYVPAALGELDLSLGLEAFEGLGRTPLLANADESIKVSGSPVVDAGGCRVGVLGLASPALLKPSGVDAGDPIEAARREVAALGDRADLVVCVSHLGLDGDKALAAAVPGIDVIVGGHDGLSMEPPVRVGRTLIVQANRQGRFLGRMRLHLLPDWRKADLFDASENERWGELAVEYDATVERFAGQRDAATSPGDRERAQHGVEQYAEEAKEARSRIRDLSDRSWFANRLVPLDARVQDDPEVAKLVSLYKEEAKRLNESLADALAAAPAEGPAYVGGASCVECHKGEHEGWRKTAHARAFETLVSRGQEMDLECIGCHTTAFQGKGGFFLPSKAGDWKGVQCEACHGPGEGHPKRKLIAAPTKDACVRCHQPPQQERFDYDSALPVARHGK